MHCRTERDGIAPALQSRDAWERPATSEMRGMGSPQHRREERDDLVPAPQSGEGWSRPGTIERRGMVSSRHRRMECDGMAPQTVEGWYRSGTAEWKEMISSQRRKAERGEITPAPRRGKATQIGEGYWLPTRQEQILFLWYLALTVVLCHKSRVIKIDIWYIILSFIYDWCLVLIIEWRSLHKWEYDS